MRHFDKLCCPLDGQPLELKGQQLVCANQHSFDIARQGYVNLLPVQHKKSRDPGDSKEMIQARRQFLDAGYFEPLAERLCQLTREQIPNTQDPCILDAGCGDGYYLYRLEQTWPESDTRHKPCFIGMDISKWAVLAAAKKYKYVTWVVGSNKQPPLCEHTVDTVLCVFGFCYLDGFSKVLTTGGRLIVVEAGPEHLMELRHMIYPTIKPYREMDLSIYQNVGFNPLKRERLRYTSEAISTAQIRNLMTMTPHLYRATQEGKDMAARADALKMRIDVFFHVFEFQP